MKTLRMNSLTGVFNQFATRFGPPTVREERKTPVGVCLRASWVLADGTSLELDEGDSLVNELGPYRTAYVKISRRAKD